jgi:MFS family permease
MSDLTKPVSGTYYAIASQFLGLVTDGYDLTMVVAMTTILSRALFPPSSSPLIASFAVVLAYSISVVFRPLGAAIFGHLSDKMGRRYSMMITIGGVGVSGFLVGLIPGYQLIGLGSYVLFVILRVFLGIFYGGESASGYTYIIEWAPPKWRGIASGFAIAGYGIGLFIAGIVVGSITTALGETAMIAYGWRYVFISALIPVIVTLFIRFKMTETPIFEGMRAKRKVEKMPFFALFKKPVVYNLLGCMVIMTGLQCFYAGTYFLPVIIHSMPGMVDTATTAYLVSANGLAQFVGCLGCGILSQWAGRRRIALIWAVMGFVTAIPMYYALLWAATVLNWVVLVALVLWMGFLHEGPWGWLSAYLSERFPTHVRASGVGFGYASGFFVGGWYAIYVPLLHQYVFQGMEPATNIWVSVAALMMLGCVIFGLGFYVGPETVGKKLGEEAAETPPQK